MSQDQARGGVVETVIPGDGGILTIKIFRGYVAKLKKDDQARDQDKPQDKIKSYPSIKRPKRFNDTQHWWTWARLEASLRQGPCLPQDKRPGTPTPQGGSGGRY